MNRFASALALLPLLLPGPLAAQGDLRERTVVLPLPRASEAVRHEFEYRVDGSERLSLDLYLPPRGSPSPVPAVVFLHGGPVPADWTGGAKAAGQYTSYGQLIAAAGLAAVIPNHRFDDMSRLPAAGDDVVAALTWLRTHGAAHGVDTSRICVWAISAGALFVAPLLRSPPPWLRCIVIYYGVLASAVLEEAGLPAPPDGFAESADALDALADGRDPAPAVLLVRAGRDFEPINAALDRFVAVALANEVALDLLTHPFGPHGFDVLQDDERSRKILRRSFAFVAAALGVHP